MELGYKEELGALLTLLNLKQRYQELERDYKMQIDESATESDIKKFDERRSDIFNDLTKLTKADRLFLSPVIDLSSLKDNSELKKCFENFKQEAFDKAYEAVTSRLGPVRTLKILEEQCGGDAYYHRLFESFRPDDTQIGFEKFLLDKGWNPAKYMQGTEGKYSEEGASSLKSLYIDWAKNYVFLVDFEELLAAIAPEPKNWELAERVQVIEKLFKKLCENYDKEESFPLIEHYISWFTKSFSGNPFLAECLENASPFIDEVENLLYGIIKEKIPNVYKYENKVFENMVTAYLTILDKKGDPPSRKKSNELLALVQWKSWLEFFAARLKR